MGQRAVQASAARSAHYSISCGPSYVRRLKKETALLSTSLAWPAVAGCSRAETFSQISAISFAQPCNFVEHDGDFLF